ncbi:MAG TPA: hypothetical protein DCY07_01405 [Rhodospirillaceae bacterium]|nr:hypothetical protein [Rhodospirillaceae bacterium]
MAHGGIPSLTLWDLVIAKLREESTECQRIIVFTFKHVLLSWFGRYNAPMFDRKSSFVTTQNGAAPAAIRIIAIIIPA